MIMLFRESYYTAAAQLVGRRTGDTVARWVASFIDPALIILNER